MTNAVIPMAPDENSVSRTKEMRDLRRTIVLMEIDDIVAIESVRLKRRLKGLAETMRAHKRGRPSVDSEVRVLRLVTRAAEPPKRRRQGKALPRTF